MSKILYENSKCQIIKDDVVSCTDISNNSIDLIITSPPYNLDIGYGSNDDNLAYDEYLKFSANWMKKCYDLARDDWRFCLNIPLDKNKWWHHSVYSDLTLVAKRVGWKYFSTVVWNEGNISRRTAWWSWLSASAPYVIAPVEMIVIFYKKQWKKLKKGESDISKENFMNWTNGVWTFNGESKKRVWHPAPFPIELPRRCMQLFSYIWDTVLDPFVGSGTTLIASAMYDRKGIGIDIDESYCSLAKSRLETFIPNFTLQEVQTYEKHKTKLSVGAHIGVLQATSK
jgi:site-specific DNA-methyltransferase (adenine-specific)